MEERPSHLPLRLLPRQRAIFDYLKREEPAVWAWFADAGPPEKQADAVRPQNNQNTVRDRNTRERYTASELLMWADFSGADRGM